MASSSKTSYAQLNQWAPGDKPKWPDLTQDNLNIDNKLQEHKTAIDGLAGGFHAPYTGEDGYWYEWDVSTAQYVKKGSSVGQTGETGPAGPPNALSIGTVQSGETAAATITGNAPEQVLNLVLPIGPEGPASTVPGPPGRGIVSIIRTSGTGAPGTTDTYTITYTDETTDTYSVYNGADGSGSGDMSKSVYDPGGKAADAFSLANMTGDTTHRTVTDTEKSTWNGKQDALGFTPISSAQKGVASGVAELDEGGHVPSSQLPSYVDDVLESASLANFPTAGETGKIYVAIDTNLSYRWSGSGYVEISPSLALGETSTTAYRGDRGKTAYDHSQAVGNPHGLTLGDIGAAAAWAQLTALPTSGTALADNAEYRVATAVGTYVFAWPDSPFECWLRFTTDATFSITFPAGTTYIGGAPTFAASKTYEMSVKDGVVIVQEVAAA